MPAPYFRCIVCERQLEPCFPDADDRALPIDGGVHFLCYGNFGTALFDPEPGEPEHRLEAVMCDPCLKAKAGFIRLYNKDGTTGVFIP